MATNEPSLPALFGFSPLFAYYIKIRAGWCYIGVKGAGTIESKQINNPEFKSKRFIKK